jgi:predicted N-formylglutamate amidohydrolase
MVVTVHSFTPVYNGTPRAVELGILHDRDTRLSGSSSPPFPPSMPASTGPMVEGRLLDTLNLHAAPRGLPHIMIEMRNDLIAEERGQDGWAQRPVRFARAGRRALDNGEVGWPPGC